MSDLSSRVWLITGTAHGLGLELVRVALQQGDSVIATSRTPEKVSATFPEYADRLRTLHVDLHDINAIKQGAAAAIEAFGHVDVLVNNAGYVLTGAVEEAAEKEVSDLFQINFFAPFHMTQALLPYFRKRRAGHIVNISSIYGLTSAAGFGIYNATKFALEGLSAALAQEVAPLGIHVTLIEPGGFRTNILAKNVLIPSRAMIPDYEVTAGAARCQAAERHTQQLGDPFLAAQAIANAVQSKHPPLHLLLGSDAYEEATEHLETIRQEMETWREVTCSTDAPNKL